MIYIGLVDGKVAIDWERYDRLRKSRNSLTEPCYQYRFTHRAIASLEGSPNEKLEQLESLLGFYSMYEIVEKEDRFCCRVTWQDRRGYGVTDTDHEAVTLAQVDLLSILCDYPIDAFRDNDTWDEFNSWDE